MDIVDQLQQQIHIESAAIAPQTSRTIETMKLAIEEIERLKRNLNGRDDFIGQRGLWTDFVDTLPR